MAAIDKDFCLRYAFDFLAANPDLGDKKYRGNCLFIPNVKAN